MRERMSLEHRPTATGRSSPSTAATLPSHIGQAARRLRRASLYTFFRRCQRDPSDAVHPHFPSPLFKTGALVHDLSVALALRRTSPIVALLIRLRTAFSSKPELPRRASSSSRPDAPVDIPVSDSSSTCVQASTSPLGPRTS
jgi:hypothetical protein